jgi:hypothetical protein
VEARGTHGKSLDSSHRNHSPALPTLLLRLRKPKGRNLV